MAMSTRERATVAGRAAQAKFTPEERRERMRKVRRDAAAKTIVAEWPDLTSEQKATLRALFGGPSR